MNIKIASNKEKDIQDSPSDSRVIVLEEYGHDGSYMESEEGKKRLAELKKLFEGKQFSGYVNPELTSTNPTDLPKKYLKLEDPTSEGTEEGEVKQMIKDYLSE